MINSTGSWHDDLQRYIYNRWYDNHIKNQNGNLSFNKYEEYFQIFSEQQLTRNLTRTSNYSSQLQSLPSFYSIPIVLKILILLLSIFIIIFLAFYNPIIIYINISQLFRDNIHQLVRKNYLVKFLLINIAASDLLATIFSEPFFLDVILYVQWRSAPILCAICLYIRWISLHVATLSVTFLAVSRCWGIDGMKLNKSSSRFLSKSKKSIKLIEDDKVENGNMTNNYSLTTNKKGLKGSTKLIPVVTTIVIWFLAFILNLPLLSTAILTDVYMIYPSGKREIVQICVNSFPVIQIGRLRLSLKFYEFFLFIFLYIIPIILITISYVCIIRSIRKKNYNINSHQMSTHLTIDKSSTSLISSQNVKFRIHNSHLKIRQRSSKLLMCLITAFLLSWLPFYSICMYRSFNQKNYTNNKYILIIQLLVNMLCLLSCFFNSFILILINKKLRSAISKFWTRFFSYFLCSNVTKNEDNFRPTNTIKRHPTSVPNHLVNKPFDYHQPTENNELLKRRQTLPHQFATIKIHFQ
ncbi:hypothetical protein SNEBB_002695 [Seison nebaliae]|nr:hypothetical protein SNEBB_002695 [Seison nebaliae]